MDKFMLYMLTAGKKALVDGGITDDVMDELNKEKCGVLIGSAMGGMKVTYLWLSFMLRFNTWEKMTLATFSSLILYAEAS